MVGAVHHQRPVQASNTALEYKFLFFFYFQMQVYETGSRINIYNKGCITHKKQEMQTFNKNLTESTER